MKQKEKKSSMIRQPELKYPAFNIMLNLIYHHSKSKLKIADMVRNSFDGIGTDKSDEQAFRNIIFSIMNNGIRFEDSRVFFILTKSEDIAEIKVDIKELVNYFFELIGKYFLMDLGDDFYNRLKYQREKALKAVIAKYIEYMSSEPNEVNLMSFAEAVIYLELTIYLVYSDKTILNKILSQIKDPDERDLIKQWGEKIEQSIKESLQGKKPFIDKN